MSTIRAHKKSDGLLLIDEQGTARYATWRERFVYWLRGTLPSKL